MEEKSYKSWTISDEFWNEVKDAIPDTAGKRDPEKTYRNKPGQGRKADFPENLGNGPGKIRRTQRNRLGMAKRRRLYGKGAIDS